jgi:hypothetical protein
VGGLGGQGTPGGHDGVNVGAAVGDNVGDSVGASEGTIVGDREGSSEGVIVRVAGAGCWAVEDGRSVGTRVGACVGTRVGATVGPAEFLFGPGAIVGVMLGWIVGENDGVRVGESDGFAVGVRELYSCLDEGENVGKRVGPSDGACVGTPVGIRVGFFVEGGHEPPGHGDGTLDGVSVGRNVGALVGGSVGECVGVREGWSVITGARSKRHGGIFFTWQSGRARRPLSQHAHRPPIRRAHLVSSPPQSRHEPEQHPTLEGMPPTLAHHVERNTCTADGVPDGESVGLQVGKAEGRTVGLVDGPVVGASVGAGVFVRLLRQL